MHEDIIWKEVRARIGLCIDCGAELLYLAHIGLVPSSQIALPIATLYICIVPIATPYFAIVPIATLYTSTLLCEHCALPHCTVFTATLPHCHILDCHTMCNTQHTLYEHCHSIVYSVTWLLKTRHW